MPQAAGPPLTAEPWAQLLAAGLQLLPATPPQPSSPDQKATNSLTRLAIGVTFDVPATVGQSGALRGPFLGQGSILKFFNNPGQTTKQSTEGPTAAVAQHACQAASGTASGVSQGCAAEGIRHAGLNQEQQQSGHVGMLSFHHEQSAQQLEGAQQVARKLEHVSGQEQGSGSAEAPPQGSTKQQQQHACSSDQHLQTSDQSEPGQVDDAMLSAHIEEQLLGQQTQEQSEPTQQLTGAHASSSQGHQHQHQYQHQPQQESHSKSERQLERDHKLAAKLQAEEVAMFQRLSHLRNSQRAAGHGSTAAARGSASGRQGGGRNGSGRGQGGPLDAFFKQSSKS